MNATEYFTYINAMFLFCIFTCGLLVWAVIRGYILKGKLTEEQDAHLKATNTNALLRSESRKIDEKLAQAEHKLRMSEKEVRDLQAKIEHAESELQLSKEINIEILKQSFQLSDKLKHIEADRIELRAERATLENQLAAAKRVRNAKGVFVRKDGTYTPKVKPLPTIADEVVDVNHKHEADISATQSAIDAIDTYNSLPKPQTLRHGMTVKNPTEKEAKEIFEAARVAGVSILGTKKHRNSTVIWFSDSYGIAWGNDRPVTGEVFMAASEFIARIKGEVG